MEFKVSGDLDGKWIKEYHVEARYFARAWFLYEGDYQRFESRCYATARAALSAVIHEVVDFVSFYELGPIVLGVKVLSASSESDITPLLRGRL